MLEQRFSDNDQSKRDIPSFIEPRPPLISNPFMRPRPQKGTNLLELFDEDSEIEEPELVQVYLRLKPHPTPNNLYEVRSDRCLITSVDTATAGHGRRTQHNVSKMYTFSHIFGSEATQKEIFENVVKDNLKKLPEGHNFTLLTYGASGSGKTYTLMGTVASPGLVPRSLEYVFKVVDAVQQPLYKPADGGADKLNYAEQNYEIQWVKRLRHVSAPLREKYRRMSAGLCSDLTISSLDLSNRTRHYVWVSFVEIYNEGIYDLLATTADRSNASKLRIREDSNGHVYVKGATQAFVKSGEEAYDVMVAGKHNLQVATTGIHAHSSRSHCIFTITMLTETEGGVRTSCVRLCDLAGCERARRTRNTGVRMAESRAINSSLHVLERCLHTLRRKGARALNTCVPYRESKLTRLLGAGLSGARGESVSMVVTLNPAPEYAHETKHVLQLAAVARNIQVNNTIAESTLESSTQDTTIASSAEVMKLRSDNERLHFELVQAQARNKELLASMEERQQEAADTMRELVEEAKDMTRQYYEAQLEALRAEMEDMTEEYESRLSKAAKTINSGTPSKSLQNKVAQFMTEIAILEEKLTLERLARARAEEEVQHLRACIEERDEKAFEESVPENREDFMMLSDSDHESDNENEDQCNESLEPTFKKEDINKSRLLVQQGHDLTSIHDESGHMSDNSARDISEHTEEKIEANESVTNKSSDTLKDQSTDEGTKESSVYATGEDDSGTTNKTTDLYDSGHSTKNISDLRDSIPEIVENCKKELNKTSKMEFHDEISNESSTTSKNKHNENNEKEEENLALDKKNLSVRCTYFVRNSEDVDNNDSINQDYEEEKPNTIMRGTYFVSDKDTQIPNENKSSANISEIEDVINPLGKITSKDKTIITAKVSETLVSKIIKSVKKSHDSNSSLAQFEQFEIAANSWGNDKRDTNEFGSAKMTTEKKRTYFDEIPEVGKSKDLNPSPRCIKENKTYFDNINIDSAASNKKVNEAVKQLDDTRSPSIVKDEITNDFKPSTIKKLLGESFNRQADVVSAVPKMMQKKHDSVDIFEGLDSPIPVTKITESIDTVENARKCIERLVLSQKSATKAQALHIKQEIKLKRLSIAEESFGKDVEENEMVNNISDRNWTQELTNSSKKIVEVTPHEVITADATNTINTNEVIPKDEKKIETVPKKVNTQNVSQSESLKVDNTIEEFENLFKDITAPRATEFELLVTQDTIAANVTHEKISNEKEKNTVQLNDSKETEETKYNLRHKTQSKAEVKFAEKIEVEVKDEVLLESHAKCESKSKPTKRSLRLRKRKNQSDDREEENDKDKLKDICNLQEEFSDVTMDLPAPVKVAKDIPSPEKCAGEENLPPLLGVQSCPSKSVTRSRRKLFTPRVEPLEESLTQPGDSNERIYVPRPSYHRARARRKL